MKDFKYYHFLPLVFLMFLSCVEDMPTQKDGELVYQLIVIDESGMIAVDTSAGYAAVSDAEVVLTSRSYFDSSNKPKQYIHYTDSDGKSIFHGLAGSDYNIQVTKAFDYEGATLTLRGSGIAEVYGQQTGIDTIKTVISFPSTVVINEIYYCGPVNRAFYFYDQFVELYNVSEDTVYLDGMLVSRALQAQHPTMETNDFVQGIYLYRFPGEPLTGRNYPLAPGEFTVLASDAINHSLYIPNAVDLSEAEWEFYNPYGGDLDNPAENLMNQLPEKSSDFLINLSHNGVILADGSDWYYGEFNEAGTYQYVHIPIETVLDAVEYSSNSELQKEITTRLDAGFAGIGMLKYSGKSVERRIPGFDTNNSTLDFVIIDTPTPGYQH